MSPSKIGSVDIAQLCAAAQPGAPMDESSRQLLDQELETLRVRREAHGLEPPKVDQLAGIALSGGGIRSASFCLGVLQALAKADLLKRFDYLSTVSGGGYIGASLTWWLSGHWRPDATEPEYAPQQSTHAHGPGLAEGQSSRAKQPWEFGLDSSNFPYGLDGAPNTPPASDIGEGNNRVSHDGKIPAKNAGPHLLNYLRKHGNYLTPGGGINILSGISVGIRAIFVNLFVWMPLITAVFLLLYWLPRILFPYYTEGTAFDGNGYQVHGPICPAEMSLGNCLSTIVTYDFTTIKTLLFTSSSSDTPPGALYVVFSDVLIISGIFALSAILYYLALKLYDYMAIDQDDPTTPRNDRRWLLSWKLWLPAIGIISVVILLYAPPKLPPDFQRYWVLILAAILAGTFGLLCLIYSLFAWALTKFTVLGHFLTNLSFEKWHNVDDGSETKASGRLARLATAGEKLASGCASTARATREFGYFMRRLFESWASVYISVFLVLLVVGSVPLVAEWLRTPEAMGTQAAPAAPAGFGIGSGVVALLGGLVATIAAFFRSGAQVGQFLRNRGFQVSGGLMAMLAAALLLFGVLVLSYHASYAILRGDIPPIVAVWVLGVALASVFLVNTNHISLGRFYRDRLMEAFMPGYDAALQERTEAAPRAADRMRLSEASMAGPYHIINTNVVLVSAEDRRRKIRGGDSFILTRDYCGSNATGWRKTDEFVAGRMNLPSAMAISGAAANPNTGVGGVGLSRSKVVSALMALVNLRLGLWVPHPTKGNQNATPNHFRPGLTSFISGHTEECPFQELTDGGHFENLGIYELIRRRARLILVCDAGQDGGFQFQDLQVALRRIEEDFGARIEFHAKSNQSTPDQARPTYPIEGLIPEDASHTYPRMLQIAKRGFAVGDVYYAADLDEHGEPRQRVDPARIIYLKATIIDELPLILRGYKAREPTFPDQSTSDQFFDEDQFEAYRDLGQRLARHMIEELRPDLESRLPKSI